jgi:hypothetical protein
MNESAVIVLNYNDYDNTYKLVSELIDYSCVDYIIVVDNKSTDESAFKLKNDFKDSIVLLMSDSNRGYAAGNNLGLKYAHDELHCAFAFVANPDIRVSERTIATIIQELDNCEYSILAPIMKDAMGNEVKLKAGKVRSYGYELMNTLFLIRQIQNKINCSCHWNYKKRIVDVDYVWGSFFGAKLEDLASVDYFDEGTFLYYEEMILGRKLCNKKIGVMNNLYFSHYHSVTIKRNVSRINSWKINLDSKKYYCKNILKINTIQYILLNILCGISMIECKLLLPLKNVYENKHYK